MEYVSLEKLHSLEIRKIDLESEIKNFLEKIECSKKKFEEARTAILEANPEMLKKLEKIEKKPNTAYGKISNYEYTSNLERAFYSLPKEIEKANKKLEELNKEIDALKGKLERHFNLRDNLPEQFHEALLHVRKEIFDCFTRQKNATIKANEDIISKPMDYVIRKNPDYSRRKHVLYVNWINAVGKDDCKHRTDEEWLEELKKNGISKYSYQNIDSYFREQSSSTVHESERIIKRQKSRNIEAETNAYFEEVKCRFIDEIARYCDEILSVEVATLGMDGSINGVIHASNGNFSIKTIGAGGYNIQCFHYRVIIRKINK